MSLTMKELAGIMVEQNKEGFKESGKRRAGKLFNDRVIAMIQPKLPMMVRGYADTDLGRFVFANAISAAIVKFGATNEKLLLLADAGIADATDNFLGSFDFEGIINDVVDGIDVSGLTKKSDTVREATASGLRKASDVIEPDDIAKGA